MKKKILILILFCLIVTSALATYAFIIRTTNAESIITFGNLKLKAHLYTIKDGKKNEVEPDDEISISKMNELSRILSVENVGNHPMYVRVFFETYIFENNKKKEANDIIMIDVKDNWIYQDGFYYYNKILKPKEITSELMDKIEFNTNIINTEYQGKSLNFKINVEAVQSENNSDSALNALGWPS